MAGYYVPASYGEAEFIEKRSRFIGHVMPVESEEEARSYIASVKKEHYDARHNCWCYIIKDGPERYSDDGEPQGTAGIPMLEVFRRAGVSNFVCVVTRYFGGVLLGAGGLLRAYTKSASDALAEAGTAEVRLWTVSSLSCSYSGAEKLKQEVVSCGGIISGIGYTDKVTLTVLVPGEDFDGFCSRIFDVSGGAIAPKKDGEEFRAVPLV